MRSAMLDHALSRVDRHDRRILCKRPFSACGAVVGLPQARRWGRYSAPASVSPHYAGKSRATPGNSAFHAKDFRPLFLVFFAVFD